MGLKQQVLTCSAIWLCVGCNTCSMECPNAVDMAAVMDALRRMAVQEKVAIAEPDVLSFHQKVIDSIFRYGRTHKLEIMMRYVSVCQPAGDCIQAGEPHHERGHSVRRGMILSRYLKSPLLAQKIRKQRLVSRSAPYPRICFKSCSGVLMGLIL
ncbi:MAG: hypothetical protein U5K27_07240 [Desulfotignum sp.]|nr:hypothetical protein [Desulfotignum sp.]